MYFNKNIGYYKPVTAILITRSSPHDRRIYFGETTTRDDYYITESELLSLSNEQDKKEINIGDLVLINDEGNIVGYYCF